MLVSMPEIRLLRSTLFTARLSSHDLGVKVGVDLTSTCTVPDSISFLDAQHTWRSAYSML